MPYKKEPYLCPRCGYETIRKDLMRKHLYNLKKPCPGQKNKIELTEPIKQEILRDRVYEIPSERDRNRCTVNLTNYVFEMDPKDKVDCIQMWDDVKPINFGDQIEKAYGGKIEKLDNRNWKYGFKLQKNNFLEIVDQSVHINSVKDLHKISLLYIKELNKIAIYHDDEWTHHLFDSGLNQIINIIRNYYLTSYEKYMLYKIFIDKTATAFETNIYKNLLNEYLSFLVAFEVYPSSKDEKNEDFLTGFKNDKNPFYISDFCMQRYNEQKEIMKLSDISRIRKSVADIIKNNNGANMKLLNKYIIDLAVNDGHFKTHLLCYATSDVNFE